MNSKTEIHDTAFMNRIFARRRPALSALVASGIKTVFQLTGRTPYDLMVIFKEQAVRARHPEFTFHHGQQATRILGEGQTDYETAGDARHSHQKHPSPLGHLRLEMIQSTLSVMGVKDISRLSNKRTCVPSMCSVQLAQGRFFRVQRRKSSFRFFSTKAEVGAFKKNRNLGHLGKDDKIVDLAVVPQLTPLKEESNEIKN